MSRLKFIALIFLGILFGACHTQTPQPAQLRVLSMIPNAKGEIAIRGQRTNQGTTKNFQIQFADSATYHALAPGPYEITLSVNGKPLFKSTYVMGRAGRYTLLAMGLLPHHWTLNPHTRIYSLKHMLAGSELADDNRYLPQWYMMRDNFGGSKGDAYIRLVNASPYTPAVTVTDDENTLEPRLVYPKETEVEKIRPGSHTLSIHYGDIQESQKSIRAKRGYIYTLVIGPKATNNGKLTLRLLRNPSKSLLKAQ